MKKPTVVLLAALLLDAGAHAQAGRIQRVDLERKPCYGTCPVYTLTLMADGTAYYNGGRYAPRQGMYKGTFNAAQLERLRPLLDRWGFWRMKERYDARVTDTAAQEVTIVTDKGRKRVREEGSAGPQELLAIQTLIDGLAANVKWTQHKLPPMP